MTIAGLLLRIALNVALFIGLVCYVTWTTDSEWRALETLKFTHPRQGGVKPSWKEIQTRFRDLSSWLLAPTTTVGTPQSRKQEQARVARAYRYLQGLHREHTRFHRQLVQWLRRYSATNVPSTDDL